MSKERDYIQSEQCLGTCSGIALGVTTLTTAADEYEDGTTRVGWREDGERETGVGRGKRAPEAG